MCTAFTHRKMGEPVAVDGVEQPYWRLLDYTCPFNLTGHPAGVMPLGFDRDGLPYRRAGGGPALARPPAPRHHEAARGAHGGVRAAAGIRVRRHGKGRTTCTAPSGNSAGGSGSASSAAGRSRSSARCIAPPRGWTTTTRSSPRCSPPIPERAKKEGVAIGIAPDRAYGSAEEMFADGEGAGGRHRRRRDHVAQ